MTITKITQRAVKHFTMNSSFAYVRSHFMKPPVYDVRS